MSKNVVKDNIITYTVTFFVLLTDRIQLKTVITKLYPLRYYNYLRIKIKKTCLNMYLQAIKDCNQAYSTKNIEIHIIENN